MKSNASSVSDDVATRSNDRRQHCIQNRLTVYEEKRYNAIGCDLWAVLRIDIRNLVLRDDSDDNALDDVTRACVKAMQRHRAHIGTISCNEIVIVLPRATQGCYHRRTVVIDKTMDVVESELGAGACERRRFLLFAIPDLYEVINYMLFSHTTPAQLISMSSPGATSGFMVQPITDQTNAWNVASLLPETVVINSVRRAIQDLPDRTSDINTRFTALLGIGYSENESASDSSEWDESGELESEDDSDTDTDNSVTADSSESDVNNDDSDDDEDEPEESSSDDEADMCLDMLVPTLLSTMGALVVMRWSMMVE